MDEVTGGWIKLHNVLLNLYSSPNIFFFRDSTVLEGPPAASRIGGFLSYLDIR
jgi:hypothetical protein